jgi:hypothetical protein
LIWNSWSWRLRPGEVMAFVLANDREIDIEGPYDTDEENKVFFEAQRGGYSHDTFGISDLSDDHDTRDLDEGWAEYLEPKGMPEFYGSAEWIFALRWRRRSMPLSSCTWTATSTA